MLPRRLSGTANTTNTLPEAAAGWHYPTSIDLRSVSHCWTATASRHRPRRDLPTSHTHAHTLRTWPEGGGNDDCARPCGSFDNVWAPPRVPHTDAPPWQPLAAAAGQRRHTSRGTRWWRQPRPSLGTTCGTTDARTHSPPPPRRRRRLHHQRRRRRWFPHWRFQRHRRRRRRRRQRLHPASRQLPPPWRPASRARGVRCQRLQPHTRWRTARCASAALLLSVAVHGGMPS